MGDCAVDKCALEGGVEGDSCGSYISSDGEYIAASSRNCNVGYYCDKSDTCAPTTNVQGAECVPGQCAFGMECLNGFCQRYFQLPVGYILGVDNNMPHLCESNFVASKRMDDGISYRCVRAPTYANEEGPVKSDHECVYYSYSYDNPTFPSLNTSEAHCGFNQD